MIKSLFISLLLTLIIEIFISYILGIRGKKDIKVVICANICTNPVVVYIANLTALFGTEMLYGIIVIILEILAVVVETFIFKKYLKFDKINPWKISLLNNVISFSSGLIIYFVFYGGM